MPGSSKMSLSINFSDQHFAYISHLLHSSNIPHPNQPDLITVTFCAQYLKII